jgi:hypothetical protein
MPRSASKSSTSRKLRANRITGRVANTSIAVLHSPKQSRGCEPPPCRVHSKRTHGKAKSGPAIGLVCVAVANGWCFVTSYLETDP